MRLRERFAGVFNYFYPLNTEVEFGTFVAELVGNILKLGFRGKQADMVLIIFKSLMEHLGEAVGELEQDNSKTKKILVLKHLRRFVIGLQIQTCHFIMGLLHFKKKQRGGLEVEHFIIKIKNSEFIQMSTQQLAYVIYRLGIIMFNYKMFNKSVLFLRFCKRISTKREMIHMKIKSYLGLCENFLILKQLDRGFSITKRCLDCCFFINDKKNELNCYKLISKIYFGKQEIELASYFNDKFMMGQTEPDNSQIK